MERNGVISSRGGEGALQLSEQTTRARVRPEIGLSFDDVLLVPKKGILSKRKDADISSEWLPGDRISIPIVSAPMESVTDANMAKATFFAGGAAVIHRFMPIDDAVKVFWEIKGYSSIAMALGVNERYDRWRRLYDAGCRNFCIDVAHGHHELVYSFIDEARNVGDSNVIVGNIATGEAAEFLADLGISAVKVGIGPGAACTTRERTGFGVPQLTAIMEVADALKDTDIKIIADGGIKHSGDIVKALAAGAHSVMLGRLLAGASETPHPGLYWGMASKRVNGHRAPEGVEGVVEKTGPVADTLKELAWGIRSGVSYAGATNLEELRQNAEFVRVTPMSSIESGARV